MKFHNIPVRYAAIGLLFTILSGNFSCRNSIDHSRKHVAVVGIPSKLFPENGRTFADCLQEIKRLAPDRTFISGDFFSLFQRNKRFPVQLDSLLQQADLNVSLIPGFTRNNPVKKMTTKYFYSEKIGDDLFLILDACDSSSVNRISPRQIDWLQKNMAGAGRARSVTVLLDRPVWDRFLFPGPNNWWEKVHPLLRLLNVKYVIAGQQPYFKMDRKKGGIEYIQSAGAGDSLSNRFQDIGNFPHFLWLSLTDEKMTVSPVRLGSILTDSVVTAKMTDEAFRIYQSAVSHPDFPLPANPGKLLKQSVRVTLQNPFSLPIRGELRWIKTNADWLIYPPLVKYQLAGRGKKSYRYNIWMVSLHSINRNLPYLETRMPSAAGSEPEIIRKYLIPLRKMTIEMRKSKIEIDGNLSEWAAVKPLFLDKEYLTTHIPNWTKSDLSAAIYSAWDKKGLYFGIDVKDNKWVNRNANAEIKKGDCVEIAFDGSWDRQVPGLDDNDHDFGFAFTENGPVAWRWHGPVDYGVGQTFSIPFQIQRLPAHTLYEIFFPITELSPIMCRAKKKFGFTIAIHDDDGQGWKGAMQWTAGLINEVYPALFGEVELN